MEFYARQMPSGDALRSEQPEIHLDLRLNMYWFTILSARLETASC